MREQTTRELKIADILLVFCCTTVFLGEIFVVKIIPMHFGTAEWPWSHKSLGNVILS